VIHTSGDPPLRSAQAMIANTPYTVSQSTNRFFDAIVIINACANVSRGSFLPISSAYRRSLTR
jgi:hypothetical protein